MYKKYAGKTIEQSQIRKTLIECLNKAKFGEKTWTTYSNRLTNFLIYAGFIARAGKKLIIQDLGTPITNREDLARRGKQRGNVFSVSVSPYTVFEVMESINNNNNKVENIRRNALSVLRRFELVSIVNNEVSLNSEAIDKYGGNVEAIWSVAKNESSLIRCIEILDESPDILNKDLAGHISDEFKLDWSNGSKIRNGGILSQWSGWIKGDRKSTRLNSSH